MDECQPLACGVTAPASPGSAGVEQRALAGGATAAATGTTAAAGGAGGGGVSGLWLGVGSGDIIALVGSSKSGKEARRCRLTPG